MTCHHHCFRYRVCVGVILLTAAGSVAGATGSGGGLEIPRRDILEANGEIPTGGDRAAATEAPERGWLADAVEPAVPSALDEAATSIAPPQADQAPTGNPMWPDVEQRQPTGTESLAIKRPDKASDDPTLGVRVNENRGLSRGDPAATWSLQDFWPLASVLALIILLAWVVKRFIPTKRLTGSGVLEVVSRMPLSSKQTLTLVKMGRRLLLLGVTGEQINTLCVVDDPDQVAMLMGEITSHRPESMTQAFARSFYREKGAYLDEPAEPDSAEAARGEVRGLLQKVREFGSKRNVA